MSHYSTGVLAEMFDISKRTLQYYDEKKILKPAFIKDNQYRIYTEGEVEQLKLILIMKSIGLNLKEIRQLLSSEGTLKTVRQLLDQKAQTTEAMIQAQQQQLKQIKKMQQMIIDTSSAPVQNLTDIDRVMKKQPQLTNLTRTMLLWGGSTTLVNLTGIGLSMKYKVGWPTALAFSYSAVVAYRMTQDYYQHVSYMCPNCQKMFKPDLWTWLFARHTPHTRYLQCPHCHFKGYSTEVYDDTNLQLNHSE